MKCWGNNDVLAILDYDAGNIESVRLALRHVGGSPVFARDAREAEKAERLVFPGVGSAGQCMRNLRERGLDGALRQAVAEGKPVLAVCIGMQLLFERSDEDGGVSGLGLLPGDVRLFKPADRRDKVPHMGWNRTRIVRPHPLLESAPLDAYYVHSYFVEPAWEDEFAAHGFPENPDLDQGSRSGDGGKAGRVLAEPGRIHGVADYAGFAFAAMVGRGSLFATQFHPEKSGAGGLAVLRRFLHWNGQLNGKPCL